MTSILLNSDCRLYNADCVQQLCQLSAESIGQINADPPYFIGFDGGKGWDSCWNNEQEYLDWYEKWVTLAWATLKNSRCLFVWGTTKTDTFLRVKMEILNSLPAAVYQNWIIWSYDWGGRTKKTFARKHEDLLMYSKGSDFLFNADDIRVPYKTIKNVRAGAQNNPLGKIPTDVWEKNNHTTSKEYVGWHPTQKPISLLSRCIKAHTVEGEIVLDPFSGSGSTAIASAQSNRKFIGIELDNDYYSKSIERFNKLVP